MSLMACQFCGEAVSPLPRDQHYRRVVGWEQVRVGGGAHSIALREEVGQWAHRWCFDHYAKQHGEQGSFL